MNKNNRQTTARHLIIQGGSIDINMRHYIFPLSWTLTGLAAGFGPEQPYSIFSRFTPKFSVPPLPLQEFSDYI